MAILIRKFLFKYAKCLGLTVLTTFFIQIIISIILFPTVNDNLLKNFGGTSLGRLEFNEVSARKNINGYGDDEDIPSKSQSHKVHPHLRTEELDFTPACAIESREAISAIHRAKTQHCKQEIVNKTCLIQNSNFYPVKLPNMCPSNGMTYGKYLGCYLDEKKFRILSSFYGNYATTNSPELCIEICIQAGFPYAGVQYASECFCGDMTPPLSAKSIEASCDMKCPGDASKICGGYFAMNIYETGLTKFVPVTPKLSSNNNKESIRIVFLLTLNGRALRQVYRLLNVLYRSHHYFYIHVDKRQDYMHRKLSVLEQQFPNVRLARKRYATIWGGASLLKMLLSSMKDFFALGWRWDYVINLSESDFPIKSLEDLEIFLSVNKGLNFVKSHGREVQRFIKKQGLDKTFIECETHMWRVGERKLPHGIVIDGGSDWIALSPEFVSYIVGKQDELLSGLDIIFQHTLLPAESFFHTVLRNSKFCNTYVDNNLHVTNWKRKLGCKCQYKHVVDWCGCSPNDFRTEDWPRIQNTLNRQLFFARKFEPVINQEVITRVEQHIGFNDHYLVQNVEGYWQNIYDTQDMPASTDDTLLSHAGSILRHNAKTLLQEGCKVELGDILEINLYKYADIYKGNLILYKASIHDTDELLVETWYKPKHHLELNFQSQYVHLVKIFKVSSEYDQKEMTFRNFASILGPLSEPVLVYQFSPQMDKLNTNFTIIWLDPSGVIADVNTIHTEENNVTNFIKLNIKTPLLPGVWKVGLLEQNNALIAVTKFLVTPLEYFAGREMTHQETSLIHSGAMSTYKNFSYLKDIGFLPEARDSLLLKELTESNVRRIGQDLREWIDSLSIAFYDVLGSCISIYSNNLKDKLVCGNHKFNECVSTEWSSLSPDPKGTIGKINTLTGRLDRV